MVFFFNWNQFEMFWSFWELFLLLMLSFYEQSISLSWSCIVSSKMFQCFASSFINISISAVQFSMNINSPNVSDKMFPNKTEMGLFASAGLVSVMSALQCSPCVSIHSLSVSQPSLCGWQVNKYVSFKYAFNIHLLLSPLPRQPIGNAPISPLISPHPLHKGKKRGFNIFEQLLSRQSDKHSYWRTVDLWYNWHRHNHIQNIWIIKCSRYEINK